MSIRLGIAIFLGLFWGCSDVNTVKTGELLITPESILFRVPEAGSRVSQVTV